MWIDVFLSLVLKFVFNLSFVGIVHGTHFFSFKILRHFTPESGNRVCMMNIEIMYSHSLEAY